jgi:hypothetical protein
MSAIELAHAIHASFVAQPHRRLWQIAHAPTAGASLTAQLDSIALLLGVEPLTHNV